MLNPDLKASVPGSHHISEVNFWPEVLADADFPKRVHLIDSTIRKTNFTAGQATSLAGFVRIAEALVELGVETTCLNITFGGGTESIPHEWALMKAILDADLPITVNCWSEVFLGNGRDRGPLDPIEALHRFVDAGAKVVAPGIVAAPDADAEARQAEDLAHFMEAVKKAGVTATMTLAGVGMRDFEQMGRMGKHAIAHGATRLDFMDSTSTMSPAAARAFVTRMRSLVGEDSPITMHMHDEFGLATACAVAACSAGAHPDVALNGMSYRCGFAPLEEVVLTLEVFHGVDTGLSLDRLDHASRVVARESGLPIPQLKPLTGQFAHLKHSAGEAAAAIRTGQDAFPPLSHGLVPARMGAQATWIWPSPSSNDLTRALAESVGLTLTDDEVTAVRTRLDAEVPETWPRWLEPDDATALLQAAVAELRGEWHHPTTVAALKEAIPAPSLIGVVLERLAAQDIGRLDPIDPDRVRPVVRSVIGSLSQGDLINLVSTFGRFDGASEGALPEQSSREEALLRASTVPDREALIEAARAYERHFGFQAVVMARGKPAAEIAAIVRNTMSSTPVEEMDRVRSDVSAILDARLVDIATPPGA